MSSIIFQKYGENSITQILDSLSELYPDCYACVTDLELNATWWSDKAMRFLGITEKIQISAWDEFKKILNPDDVPEYEEVLYSKLKGEKLDWELNLRVNTAEGEEFMLSFHTGIVNTEDGHKIFTCVMKNENVLPVFDPVTDLYSFARLGSDLDRDIKEHSSVALLMISMEHFNNISIAYGAEFSIEVLKKASLNLIYAMDSNTAVYKLIGENFGFVLRDCDIEGLKKFERNIRSIFQNDIRIDDIHVPIQIAAGAVILTDKATDAATARSQAAYALHHSSQKHLGQLIVFNEEVTTSHNVNLNLMRVIHQSARNGCDGFYVQFQPIVDSTNGNIIGSEALVRWGKEPYGNVPPSMFIEWMEDDPCMYDLGCFVLRMALKSGTLFIKRLPKYIMNVNLSARQIENEAFREDLIKILKETGFPPENLCLELTERCKDLPLDRIYDEVSFLHSLGIKVAMDDYGTGSASSSIIMAVPMDEIKLDMSFIRGIKSSEKKQAMVKAIVDMANASGMKTCLEGVEDEELQDYLRKYNATWFQGYYYSKPVGEEAILNMLSEL